MEWGRKLSEAQCAFPTPLSSEPINDFIAQGMKLLNLPFSELPSSPDFMTLGLSSALTPYSPHPHGWNIYAGVPV